MLTLKPGLYDATATGLQAADLQCACFKATNKSALSPITLTHAYARLTLTVTKDASFAAAATFTNLSLAGTHIYTEGTYNVFNTTVPFPASAYSGARTGTQAIDCPISPASTLPQGATANTCTFSLLLIPVSLTTDDIKLTLTVNGEKMSVKLPISKIAGSKFEAGKNYNVNLTLTSGTLTVSSVSLVNWENAGQMGGDLDASYPKS
ncbi:MAG: fimbrillin family protein [Bacteroides sp.]|nr:fimbrillin family protein [Bacteroides sp.]